MENGLFGIHLRRSLLASAALLASGCQMASLPGLGGASAAPSEPPVAARAQFESALAAQRAEQWPEAERQFAQMLEKYPYLSGPALNLASIYAQTQRPQLAEEHYQSALRINPDNFAAGVQYGVWLRKQGRFADAEAVYLKTLERNPDYADAHLNLAILYDLYLGRLAPALEHYQHYLAASGATDSPVQGWVADLERRLQRGGGAS
jgi:tetratricopeptide (TPR) repeat protein